MRYQKFKLFKGWFTLQGMVYHSGTKGMKIISIKRDFAYFSWRISSYFRRGILFGVHLRPYQNNRKNTKIYKPKSNPASKSYSNLNANPNSKPYSISYLNPNPNLLIKAANRFFQLYLVQLC